MWTETGSVTRLLLSKLKTRPDPTRPDPYFSSLIRDILCMATYSYSGYHGHQSNVISIYILHYHGHISKRKTVLKILGKRKKKHKESSNKKVWDNQQVQNWFKKSTEECYAIVARNNLPRHLFLLCIAYVLLRDDKENSALKLD